MGPSHTIKEDQAPLAQLRELLSLTPTTERFVALLSMLCEWPSPETFDMGLTYASEHLEDWATDTRAADKSLFLQLWPDFPEGTPHPTASLIRHLELPRFRLSTPGTKALLESQLLHTITTLDLANNGLGPDGAKMLAACPEMSTLQSLNIAHNSLGHLGLKALLESPHLDSLHTLDISYNDLGYPGFEALIYSQLLFQLHSLSLAGNTLAHPYTSGAERFGRFIISRRLTEMKRLDLRDCSLTDDCALAIAMSEHIGGLEQLLLTQNPALSQESIELIASAEQLSPSLRHNCLAMFSKN